MLAELNARPCPKVLAVNHAEEEPTRPRTSQPAGKARREKVAGEVGGATGWGLCAPLLLIASLLLWLAACDVHETPADHLDGVTA